MEMCTHTKNTSSWCDTGFVGAHTLSVKFPAQFVKFVWKSSKKLISLQIKIKAIDFHLPMQNHFSIDLKRFIHIDGINSHLGYFKYKLNGKFWSMKTSNGAVQLDVTHTHANSIFSSSQWFRGIFSFHCWHWVKVRAILNLCWRCLFNLIWLMSL